MSAYIYNPPKALAAAIQREKPSPVPGGPLELGFARDASGSMASCASALIEAFNALLASQRENAPAARGSVMLFSDKAHLLQDGVSLAEIVPLSKETYCLGGGTALNDAIGGLIGAIAARTDRIESRHEQQARKQQKNAISPLWKLPYPGQKEIMNESQTFFVIAVSSRTIRIGDYLPGKKTTLAK
jgi:hypothetical protein